MTFDGRSRLTNDRAKILMNLRSGRFDKGMAQPMEAYSASIAYDRRLAPYDIAGSIAHASALARAGLLTAGEAESIIAGLTSIAEEIEQGRFPFRDELEDIHMNVEARLREKIGDAAAKLHTARSRNDQVALDMRLFVKDAAGEAVRRIRALQGAIVELAEAHQDAVMPGYTHLQRAQPVLLAHHLLAYFEMLERDAARFRQARERADVMPLGSGALAGVPYPLDRELVAQELGFSRISQNSMDAVADRDFVLDYLYAAAVCMMHLSRLAEEIVVWSTAEFGFIELDDAYATGSSIMPQKKNPDAAELARGKTGRVYGHLLGLLTVLKGLPLTYNRDLQEDKEGLFDAVDTLLLTLEVFRGMVATLKVNQARMAQAAEEDFILATDLADYLVRQGVAFRDAHGIVGRLVRHAIEEGKALSELSLDDYRRFSPHFGDDVFAITAATSVAARDLPGGTAPEQVSKALAAARRRMENS